VMVIVMVIMKAMMMARDRPVHKDAAYVRAYVCVCDQSTRMLRMACVMSLCTSSM
jgi:hypothetical protein